jgi:hypothetical protein
MMFALAAACGGYAVMVGDKLHSDGTVLADPHNAGLARWLTSVACAEHVNVTCQMLLLLPLPPFAL